MILINVLPPELRKRESGVSPVFLALVAGCIVNLGVGLLWAYVQLSLIPEGRELLQERQNELDRKEILVAEIEAERTRINAFKTRRTTLFALLGTKVFMARPLNEFVTLMSSNPYQKGGFAVNIDRLDIQPVRDESSRKRGKSKGPQLQQVQWNLGVTLVGEQYDLAGDYLKDFFQTIGNSSFWTDNSFTEYPAKSYPGDTPIYNQAIQKVAIDFSLTWTRAVMPVKFVTVEKASAVTDPAAASGGG